MEAAGNWTEWWVRHIEIALIEHSSIVMEQMSDAKNRPVNELIREGHGKDLHNINGNASKGDHLGPQIPKHLKNIVRTKIVHTSGIVFDICSNKC